MYPKEAVRPLRLEEAHPYLWDRVDDAYSLVLVFLSVLEYLTVEACRREVQVNLLEFLYQLAPEHPYRSVQMCLLGSGYLLAAE